MTRGLRVLVLSWAWAIAAAGLCARAAGEGGEPLRGVWVTRWDYLTPEDVERCVRECAALGITDVFWQVRGQADAYYRSGLEPWGEFLFRGPNEGKADPGFDPLAKAVEAAHGHGLRLHAWFNVMPLWRERTPPASRDHAFYTKPSWRLVDERGEAQALNEHYVIVNPLLEGVREHIVAVAADIVNRYGVDGLHLDYVRFVTDAMDTSRVYPADAVSRSMLRERTGSDGVDAASQRAALRGLIRSSITQIVARLKREVTGPRGVTLSAAVWRRPEIARDRYEQDATAWLSEGLIDVAIPMIYTDDAGRFADDLAAWRAAAGGGAIAAGIGVYKHADGAASVAQIELAGEGGFVLFAYSALFESRALEQDRGPAGDEERAARLGPIGERLRD